MQLLTKSLVLKDRSGLVTIEQAYLNVNIAESRVTEVARANPSIKDRWTVRLLWLGFVGAVSGLGAFAAFGWDARDYLSALQQYQAYINGQESSSLAYSPLFMIPTVGIARLLPLWLTIALFGVAYFSGWLTQLWVGMQFATADERRILHCVAPVIAFFPGLLISDVIVSGNLAYILYGLMLASAALGWKRGRWEWFYLAVLLAACVKVHLLTMLAIPLLCGKRQWLRTLATGAFGVALYAMQCRIWPQAFGIYLNSLKLMSQSRRDFGCAPVGNLARVLQIIGVPYEKPCILFYVVYAAAMFLILLSLARLYREERISFVNWAPVMLLGVVLLNPRILTYDVAAVSLPMALVAWRLIRDSGGAQTPKLLAGCSMLLVLNVFVEANEDLVTVLPDAWKYVEMFLMFGIFAGGVGRLLKEAGIEWSSTSDYFVPESFIGESHVSESELGSFD